MRLQKNSHIGISLALCLGLSTAAFMTQAHEESAASASGPDSGQTDRDEMAGTEHRYPHGKGHQGHHGKGDYSGHHSMGGQAGMGHGMHGNPAKSRTPMMDLDLDEDQLEDIAEIQRELRSDLRELKVERYEESLKLEELYSEDELDAGDIVDQQQRVFDVIKEITELQVEAQQDIRDLLTTEQKNQVSRTGAWLR